MAEEGSRRRPIGTPGARGITRSKTPTSRNAARGADEARTSGNSRYRARCFRRAQSSPHSDAGAETTTRSTSGACSRHQTVSCCAASETRADIRTAESNLAADGHGSAIRG